jgi:hypothetical protein
VGSFSERVDWGVLAGFQPSGLSSQVDEALMDYRERDGIERAFRNVDGNFRRLGQIIDKHAKMLNQHQDFINKETAKQIMQAEKELIVHSIDNLFGPNSQLAVSRRRGSGAVLAARWTRRGSMPSS